MAEAIAADGARVVPDDGRLALVLRGDLLVDVLVVLLDPTLGRRAVPVLPFSASSSWRAISSASIPASASIW